MKRLKTFLQSLSPLEKSGEIERMKEYASHYLVALRCFPWPL